MDLASQSIQMSNRFNVALSGGHSPVEFLSKLVHLSEFNLWSKTHIFQVDEHFVPQDDHESNFKMIKENLLNYIDIPVENLHPIPTDQENAGLTAEQYKNDLVAHFDLTKNGLPCFDFILLGIGEDGHTASLFPDDPNVEHKQRVTLPVSLNYLKHERVSLTLSVINNARNAFMLITGEKKADVIKRIIDGKELMPASKVNLTDGEFFLLLDLEAASKLSDKEKYFYQDEAISL